MYTEITATLHRAGLRTARGLLVLDTILFILSFGVLEHDAFLFPLGVAYMAYGVLRATILGFFLDAGEDEEADIAGPIVITDGGRGGGGGGGGGGGAGSDAYGQRQRGISPHGGAS